MAIFLIEDSQVDALYLRDSLARAGYELEHFPRQADFLERFAVKPPAEASASLIIADLFLPEADGIELLRNLKTSAVAAPIILISGNDDQHLNMARELGLSWGLNILDALRKPGDIARILDHIRACRIAPAAG